MAIEDILENARLSKIFKNTFGAVSEVGLRSSYKHEPCTQFLAINKRSWNKSTLSWEC